jgi:uncharacterized protein YpmS
MNFLLLIVGLTLLLVVFVFVLIIGRPPDVQNKEFISTTSSGGKDAAALNMNKLLEALQTNIKQYTTYLDDNLSGEEVKSSCSDVLVNVINEEHDKYIIKNALQLHTADLESKKSGSDNVETILSARDSLNDLCGFLDGESITNGIQTKYSVSDKKCAEELLNTLKKQKKQYELLLAHVIRVPPVVYPRIPGYNT